MLYQLSYEVKLISFNISLMTGLHFAALKFVGGMLGPGINIPPHLQIIGQQNIGLCTGCFNIIMFLFGAHQKSFKSLSDHDRNQINIAQLVEHWTSKPKVAGSIPTTVIRQTFQLAHCEYTLSNITNALYTTP